MLWVYYYDKVLLALRRIMKCFKKCPSSMFVIVLMLGSLFMQFLPANIVNNGGSANHAGNKVDQVTSRPKTSASAPFTPSVTFGGSGSNLFVNDTFNGTIKNDAVTLQGNQSMSVPIIAPADTSHLPTVVAGANVSRVSVKLKPVNVPPVIIPWNTSISRQNKTMPGQTIAQSFYIGNYSTVTNVSIRGFMNSPFYTLGLPTTTDISIIQGLLNSTNPITITHQQFIGLNSLFNYNTSTQWYDFNLPDNFTSPGLYSLEISISSVNTLVGNLSFCLVNGTKYPGMAAYNYTAATGWRPITEHNNITALDFSIKVGLQSATDAFLSRSSIRACIGTATGSGKWENFTKTTHEVTLGQGDGTPWVPTVNVTSSVPIHAYFGVPLIITSNNSMQLNASINITYIKNGFYSSTVYSFTISSSSTAWNGTYNSTMPRWNDYTNFNNTKINQTVYTLHVRPSTQAFTIAMPSRWNAINITQPMVKSLGKVPDITVTNVSLYAQKIWNFVARSSKMIFNMSVNGTKFSNGDTIHFNGSMVTRFSSTYSGNASFWINSITRYWNNVQSFSGSSFSFTQGFKVPADTIVPSGYYTCFVIVTNGTDIGCNATGITIVYISNAHIAGNNILHDIEGPFGSTILVKVRLAVNITGTGLPNATASTTWGAQNIAWWYTNVAGESGNYTFSFNTSATYCTPGDKKNVTIMFTRPDIYTTSLLLHVHPWKNSSLIVQPYSTSIFVNQTVPVYINYTDTGNMILKNIGQLHVPFTYFLGSYSHTVLNFQVYNMSTWTFVIGLNTTRIPRIAKAGNYMFVLNIQAKFDNGTWYHPQSFNTTIHVLALPLSWNITRLDATFNSTLPSRQITEFEGVSNPSPFWVHVNKTVYPNENTSSIVNATGLTVQLDFNNASIELVEDGARHGLYRGVIDLTSMSAPRVMDANITITGNDVGSQHFSIQIHLIKRYVLHGELVNPPDSFTENQIISLRFKLSYVDKDGVTNIYSNKSVKVRLSIYDGSITIPFDYTMTTDDDGQILLANISLPKVMPGAKVSLQVTVVGDKRIDPGISWTVSVPVGQDFWYRNGLTILIIIIIAAIGIALFIKQGVPRLKLRREETKIAIVKTRQDTKPQAKIKLLDGGAEHEPIDIDVLESSFGFPTVHMMPPELIDLDLRSKSVKRSRASRVGTDGAKGSSGTGMDSPGTSTDYDDLVKEKTEAIDKALELEHQGDVAGAIEYYKKVVEVARKLTHDEDAFTYEKKVEDLLSKRKNPAN